MSLRTLSLPSFRKISEDDFKSYNEIFNGSSCLVSDLTPNALRVWLNHDGRLQYTCLRGVAVLQYTNDSPPDLSARTSIIGHDADIVDVVHTVLDHLEKSRGQQPRLHLVPENIATKLMRDTSLTVAEDKSSTNYLFNPKQQVLESQMPGSKRAAVVRKFERTYQNLTIEVYALPNHQISDELLNVYEAWQATGSTTRSDPFDLETPALRRWMNSKSLASPAYAIILRCQNVPISFGIYQLMSQGGKRTACLHHLKANYLFTGISEYFFHCVMRHMMNISVEVLNGEQDLGIEGMRRFKQKLGPCGYEKVYTVSRK